MVARSGLPVPAGLLALLSLMVLLLSPAMPQHAVDRGADALLKVLPALFLPPGLAVVRGLPLVRQHALGLAAVLVGSLVVGQVVAGLVAEAAMKRERR